MGLLVNRQSPIFPLFRIILNVFGAFQAFSVLVLYLALLHS